MKDAKMPMADMKMSKSEKKQMYGTAAPSESTSGPDYPWGLEINLDDAALKKLGIKELPDAGTECQVMATGKITEASQSAKASGEGRRSLRIQLVKLHLECETDEKAAFNKVFDDK